MALARNVATPRIVRTRGVQGGEPVVRGTRIPVRAIIVAWREYADLPTILQAYPRLSEEDVREALGYYEAHRSEIDEIIRAQLADE